MDDEGKTGRRAGYTMLFDDVVEREGTIAAVVFGCVLRHERMRDGYCHASLKTIAQLTGLCVRTVRYRLRDLERAGLIMRIKDSSVHVPCGYMTSYAPEGGSRCRSIREQVHQMPL